MKIFSFVILAFVSFLTSSCTPTDIHHAACNELKSQIVFSGATSDTRQAEIENSERFLQQRTFDDSDCGCYNLLGTY